jgi:hypothetical protein
MQAMVINQFGGPEQLVLIQNPMRQPGVVSLPICA